MIYNYINKYFNLQFNLQNIFIINNVIKPKSN